MHDLGGGRARVLRTIHAVCLFLAVPPLLVVAFGWAIGSVDLERFVPGETTMKLNTAIAALLLVVALAPPGRSRRAGAVAGLAVAAYGVVTLLEYALGVDLRIDQLLVHDPVPSAHPGRTSPNAALVLVLLGVAAFLLPRARNAARIGHACVSAALVVCFAAIVGFVVGSRELYGGSSAYMAVPGVITLTLLSVAALLTRLDVGLGRLLASDRLDGRVFRLALVPAIVVPLACGVLRSGLVAAGVSEVAAAWLYGVTGVVVMTASAALVAHYLGRADAAAAEADARLRAIVSLSPLAVVTVDTQGTVTSWNPAAERLFGYAAEEVLGKAYPLLGEEEGRAIAARIEQFASGETLEVERPRLRKDGTSIDVRVALAPVRAADGSFAGVSGVMTDITAQRALEEGLLTSKDELESLVAERTAELVAANRELQAFSYSVSHDLRAPLRALEGFATALEEDYGPQLDATAHDYIGRIQGGARRMSDLIDDVLQLARVTRLELRRERVDVTELSRTLAGEIAAARPGEHVEIDVQDGLVAVGDVALARIVLQNLLENAWKFSATQETPRIDVRAGRDGEIVVVDNGVGFDPAYADKLFRPFQRLHAAVDFPGNGIGLATVQNIVNRHGGFARAESEPGAGATFTFKLAPAHAVADDAPGSTATAEGA